MIIGSHVKMNAPEYVLGSVKEAISYGANALMLYTGAPQNTKRVPVEKLKIKEAHALMEEVGIQKEHVIVHAPYLINFANCVKEEIGQLAKEFMASELLRTQEIGSKYIVLHPGSYTTTDAKTGIETIIKHFNQMDIDYKDTIVCLETMAGKGSEVGRSFEELEEILSGLHHVDSFGVCLDTCHIHDAGYDVSQFDEVLNQFDSVIGLKHLHVIHLNDSKNERGAHKDRHENIGKGKIGFDTLHQVVTNERIKNIPIILETPYVNEKPPYKIEIEMLQNGIYDEKRFEELLV